MKALVTGATGFIGGHLVTELVKKGYRVTCLVRKTSNLKWLEATDADMFYGDCEDETSLKGLADDFTYVFHLAGLTKAKTDKEFFSANVQGTENILRAVSSRNQGLKRFIHLSSLAAVGPSRNGTPLDETVKPTPVSAYGRSKLEGEAAVLRYKELLPVTIIRPPAVYGPRDRDFYLFFKMVKRGFYPYWGKCYYSMLYVDDLVRGLIMAARAKGTGSEIYFLADSRVYSNEDIVREIINALGVKKALKIPVPKPAMKLITEIGSRLGSGMSIINRDKLNELKHSHWLCNAGKAERELGFIAQVRLREGIKWTGDWYRIHQWL